MILLHLSVLPRLFPGVLSTRKFIFIFGLSNLRIFNAFKLIQFLHKALRHGSLAGLCPESFNQSFILTDIILLVFIGSLLQFYPDRFLFFVKIIIAL